jgi:hypothetical protein
MKTKERSQKAVFLHTISRLTEIAPITLTGEDLLLRSAFYLFAWENEEIRNKVTCANGWGRWSPAGLWITTHGTASMPSRANTPLS